MANQSTVALKLDAIRGYWNFVLFAAMTGNRAAERFGSSRKRTSKAAVWGIIGGVAVAAAVGLGLGLGNGGNSSANSGIGVGTPTIGAPG
jgi:hypothetical protein